MSPLVRNAPRLEALPPYRYKILLDTAVEFRSEASDLPTWCTVVRLVSTGAWPDTTDLIWHKRHPGWDLTPAPADSAAPLREACLEEPPNLLWPGGGSVSSRFFAIPCLQWLRLQVSVVSPGRPELKGDKSVRY